MAKTVKSSISNLKKRLDKVEKELKQVSIEIATTDKTSNLYWSSLKKRAVKAYEEARIIYREWSELNIPFFYDKNIVNEVKRIKDMKFKPPKDIKKVSTFLNNDINTRTKTTITSESISDYFLGLDGGGRTLNRLMTMTQQLLIQEDAINKSIVEGIEKGEALFTTRKKVQQTLLKDALDEKYITILDKNGKPRQYGVKSYAELVSRTKITDAQALGTINTALGFGSDLVQVSSHNTLTPYDAQFEGKIFSITGNNPDFPKMEDRPPFHPNCRHVLTVIFKEVLEQRGTLEKMSDFSKGKIDVPPNKPSFIPLDKRKF